MKVIVFLLILMPLFNCCVNTEHIRTCEVGNGLYKEIYIVTNGDLCTVYLTDSITFRKYLGQYYDVGDYLFCEINNQFIDVYKKTGYVKRSENPFRMWTVYDSTKIASYNIDELKREGKFE